ncbi:MAG TPA: sulfurtransferase TusA family protein [Agitococcus sp.]|jgi:tRNA 2-thiouridine synthesizing protein A|uniref:sulfurtransferase TusA family protein n=1 Tax=uncultured Agitococcus sp. TaxID=1506599 RepID=UPI002604C065|nr:sulfurtransferase TusA family protein [uncultured Agitococcus sp.]HMU86935.1 sulfurtransferase TusA family protein [Agitococcus sp.]HMX98213.1 sulfurtransferase TusA family protein [Agitococcus sp.]HMY27418.1 sulfurtransferase TusA family protein [Agitococcus sp.]HMY82634.1 sulfurtransferase TusA family protein [Agitococcus sp.]HNA19915.1 sulfurtransferase TusA family protein [Agitococcus sp.]
MNQLDARGLRCPMPLLKLKQSLHQMNAGEVLTVMTTDPISQRDFVVFLRQSPHQLLSMHQEQDVFYFQIEKAR